MRNAKSGDEEVKEESPSLVPTKRMEAYEKVFENNTEFFSSYTPDMIEEALLHHLKHVEKVEATVNNDKYKVKFTLVTKDSEVVQELKICVKILKVDDATVCVEFSKLSGSNERFQNHYAELKQVLEFCNDTKA